MTRALNPVPKNAERVRKELRRQAEELNWDGIEFPTPNSGKMFGRFEKNNNVSLLVLGHERADKIRIIPLYVPKKRHERTVRLFFLKSEDGEGSHYCVINSMSRLVGGQASKKKVKKYVCDNCLNYFGREDLLIKHIEYCLKARRSEHNISHTKF